MTSIHRVANDSILILDWQQSRVSVFAAGGEYVRSFVLGPSGSGLPQLIGTFDTGAMAAVVRPLAPSTPVHSGLIRIPSLYVVYNAAGELTDTIGEFPDQETYVGSAGAGPFQAPPFGRWAATAAGGDRFYFGDATTFEYRVYSETGRLLGVVRRVLQPQPVLAGDVERHKAERLRNVTDQSRRAAVERELADAAYPDVMPAYSNFEVDSDGHLWIQAYRAHEAATSSWSVYDGDGVWLGELELPSALNVLEIGSDYLLGRWRAADEVEQVRLYRLDRRRS